MAWKDARTIVLTIAAALMIAAPAVVMATAGQGAQDDEAAEPMRMETAGAAGDHEHADGQDHAHDAPEAEADQRHPWRPRTEWPEARGEIPEGPEGLAQISRVTIEGEPDKKALREEGINLTGSGTHEDPYVLEGLRVTSELELKDTVDYYVVKENYIDGTLRLNWNGDKVHVHHNYIQDLRVNENDPRVELATGGLIEENAIDVVGQIRHYDGVFTRNEVGPVPGGFFDPLLTDTGELVAVPVREQLALNIDGFDGGVFEDNTIHGAVDMQLHGHHHASCFGCVSHNHGDEEVSERYNHSIRYHMTAFRSNVVETDSTIPTFRYQDTGHAGDDRTANSEPEMDLEGPHVHHTYILVEDNELTGGPMVVDILNADDEYHHQYNPAEMVLRGNTISYTVADRTLRTGLMEQWGPHGIILSETKEMQLEVTGNSVTIENGHDASLTRQAVETVGLGMEESNIGGYRPAAVWIDEASNGTLSLQGNALAGTYYGVFAQYLDEKVDWTVQDNEFQGVEEPIEYDDTVESKPER